MSYQKSKKNFTPEAIREGIERAGGRCEHCGRHSSYGLQAHHMKTKSTLSLDECDTKEKQLANMVILCTICHGDVHARVAGTERFRTRSWQKIGETEADEKTRQN